MLCDSKTNGVVYYRRYTLPTISSIDAACEWLIKSALISEISISYFELYDGKSFHDGTVTTPESDPIKFKELVKIHKNDELLSLRLFAEYVGTSFALIIYLDTYHIQLSYACEKNLDYKKIEELLGLAEL